MEKNNCEIKNCSNEATHLASTETNIIEICILNPYNGCT